MFGSIGCENGVLAFGTMPCGDYAIKDGVQARYAHHNMAMSTLTSKVADHANDEGDFFVMELHIVFSTVRIISRTKSRRIPMP